jgi:hypothetical protein
MSMPTIELILHKVDNPRECLSLYFNLRSTAIAAKHLLLLQKHLENKITIHAPDRTFNFPGDGRDKVWIAQKLNECITTINNYFPVIKHRAFPDMDQEHMNQLHKYFEVYRGPVSTPAKFYRLAPTEVKSAFSDYNSLIHRYEDFGRNLESVKNGNAPAAKIVLNYSSSERHLLAEEDFLQFTTRIVFGCYYLNYCEVGKPIWDMYQDNDDVVGEENILPLKYYSADALIEFSPTCSEEVDDNNRKLFSEWWDKNIALMDSLGFKKGAPTNAIGHIPLADLDRNRGVIAGKNEAEIRELIGQYPLILKTAILPHHNLS